MPEMKKSVWRHALCEAIPNVAFVANNSHHALSAAVASWNLRTASTIALCEKLETANIMMDAARAWRMFHFRLQWHSRVHRMSWTFLLKADNPSLINLDSPIN